MPDYPFKQKLVYTFISQYYAMVLPGRVGGEAAKIFLIAKSYKNAERLIASIGLDRITGLAGLGLIGIFGFINSAHVLPAGVKESLIVVTAIFVLLPWLALIPVELLPPQVLGLKFPRLEIIKKSTEIFFRILASCRLYLNTPHLILFSIFGGVVFQSVTILLLVQLSAGLHIQVSYFDWCWIMAIVSFFVFLPISIGGIGVREGVLFALLGTLEINEEKILAFSFAIFAIHLLGAILGMVIDFIWIRYHK